MVTILGKAVLVMPNWKSDKVDHIECKILPFGSMPIAHIVKS